MTIVVPDEYKYLYVYDKDHPILKFPHDALRTPSKAVAKVTKKQQILVDSMLRIMRQAHGVGLAAPQLGIHERVIVIAPQGKQMALINPKVVSSSGTAVGEEGCLSIPGLYGDVERPETVVVEAMDRKGREMTLEMTGMSARVVQHEIDHLDGVLFIDKVQASTLHWIHPYSDEE
ncbi:MAG: peptide deformylase [Chthonomonadaceae bacterium]|jgi:peptide deformylase|nr:peptide deformylase [Chthonomonadaceae bacterium]